MVSAHVMGHAIVQRHGAVVQAWWWWRRRWECGVRGRSPYPPQDGLAERPRATQRLARRKRFASAIVAAAAASSAQALMPGRPAHRGAVGSVPQRFGRFGGVQPVEAFAGGDPLPASDALHLSAVTSLFDRPELVSVGTGVWDVSRAGSPWRSALVWVEIFDNTVHSKSVDAVDFEAAALCDVGGRAEAGYG